MIGSASSDKYYIGSTIKSLNTRFTNHKYDYKLWLDNKTTWCSSFELIKNDDCYIKLIEDFPCATKKIKRS
jgi:hypothetical protein